MSEFTESELAEFDEAIQKGKEYWAEVEAEDKTGSRFKAEMRDQKIYKKGPHKIYEEDGNHFLKGKAVIKLPIKSPYNKITSISTQDLDEILDEMSLSELGEILLEAIELETFK